MATQAFGHKATRFSQLPQIAEKRGLFILIGILLMIAGGLAIYLAVYTTFLTVMLLGILIAIGGVFLLAHAALSRQWQGFLVNLLTGLIYVVLGTFLATNPGLGAISLTLVIAAFLIGIGIFRIALSIATRIEHWGWFFLSGVVSVLLGAFIWAQWPIFGLLVIGIYMGIELLASGITLLALAINSRKLSRLQAV